MLTQIKTTRQKLYDRAQQTEFLRGTILINNDSASRFQMYSLQPKKGGRLQPMEQTHAAATMLRAFLRDITPREARGLVITTYRSTAITISVIILQIPNSAPQKAYNSQPGGREGGRKKQWRGRTNMFTDYNYQDKCIFGQQILKFSNNSWKHGADCVCYLRNTVLLTVLDTYISLWCCYRLTSITNSLYSLLLSHFFPHCIK